jgi:FG-GAP-like repeat
MKSFHPWKTASREAFVVIVVGLGLALTSPVAGAQSYLFDEAGLTTGNGPAGVIVADFNHDHRLDLAVTNVDDNTVSVFLGTRSGGFTAKVDYATGVSPGALVSSDFRGNGKADLAVVNEYESGTPGTVSILLGNGDGTFQTHVDYPVGNYPVGIVAADFNGDGKTDLAVVNNTDSTVSILFGNGDGTFQSQILVSVGTEPTSLGSGDFNGDGKVDLITSNVGAGTVTVLLNKGNGSFTRVDSSTGILAPDFSALAVADYNRDRKLDVAISSISRGLFLLLGNGDGSFQSPVAIPSSVPDNIHFLLAGDFNQDGKLDLIEEGVAGVVFVLLGNGDGTFRQAVFSFLGVDVTATSFASADVNGDGLPDLAAVSGSLQVLLGKGDGTFAVPATVRLDQDADGSDAALAADFNGDGKLDLAVAEVNFPHGLISVELGKGDGTFQKPIVSPIIGAGINNQDLMRAGDFNGDGKADLIIMDDYATGFEVLLGNGDGTFQAPVDTTVSSNGITFEVGDFNTDGKTDLVVTTTTGINTSLNIYLSNGDGTFRQGAQYAVNNGAPVVADVNRDGKVDLITAGFGSPLQVFLGNGDGTFQNPISGPTAFYSGGVVIDDFNGDGKLDVVALTYDGIAFLAGNGDGTFQSPTYSDSALQFCCQLVASDVSGDGKLDLVNIYGGSGVVVMLGNGDGTFQAPVTYGAPGQVASGTLGIGDFNSDGIADIGMANQGVYTAKNIVSLYLSEPTPYIFPTAVNFGAERVGKTTAPKKIELTDSGNARLKLFSITVTGDFLETNNCGKRRGIGKSCTIDVSFKPKTKGERTGLVTISDNASASPQKVHLKGTGD